MLQRLIASLMAFVTMLLSIGKNVPPKTEPKFNGTFLQCWMCSQWDDARWQSEIAYMKESGIEHLILQDVAERDSGIVYYPSALDYFKDCQQVGDTIGDALRNCKDSGIKVFVGLTNFNAWWVLGGLTPEYNTLCNNMALMVEEIYSKYYESYSDVFYGWYFTPEISNIPTVKLSMPNIISGFNKVADKATELNPNMPIMLSPYFTEHIAVPSVVATLPMWQMFMQGAHLRDGDIFAPQDAVGAAWVDIEDLDKMWCMFSAAVQSSDKKIKLWANCENMIVARGSVPLMPPATVETENIAYTLDRFVKQMNIASKYVENIITFSFNHFYCPEVANRAYYDTYLDYISNNYTLENVPPTEPQGVSISNGILTFEPATDNIGIAFYLVYDGDKKIARIENGSALTLEINSKNEISVVAYDAAGNKSQPVTATVK